MRYRVMGRKRIHPDYDPERVLKELIGIATKICGYFFEYR